jgi:hypothetical protein
MKAQAKKLIAYLRRTKKVKIASYYKCSYTSWDYYYNISGWLKGEYFSIYLFKHEDHTSENKIASTTDCVEKMQNLFNKYSLDETRQ